MSNLKFQNPIRFQKKGFTLVETVVALTIFALMMTAVTLFARNIFYFNLIVADNLGLEYETRKVLEPMTDEIRSASPSSIGAYPIEAAGTSTLTFFTDINGDGLRERIRYFLSGTTLKKGTIVPAGNPLVYSSSTENIVDVVHNVRNSTSTNVFDYYDANFTGSSTPLTQPVSVSIVRLVKITIVVDANVGLPLRSKTVTVEAALRNLKDNL